VAASSVVSSFCSHALWVIAGDLSELRRATVFLALGLQATANARQKTAMRPSPR
jgi:hypothetical protein